MEQSRSSAPVSASAEIDIAAPRPEVWAILSDIAAWPTWNPAIRESVQDPQLDVGSRFRFSTEIGTLKCRVTALEVPGSFEWKGRVLFLGERQSWQLETTEAGTHVTVLAEMTGLAAWLLKRRLTERLEAVLVSVLDLLRLEAEVRTSEAEEGAPNVARTEEGRAR
ncbi:MAG: SRPBCC family protein [Candidatus Limnocylindrales bacterium]